MVFVNFYFFVKNPGLGGVKVTPGDFYNDFPILRPSRPKVEGKGAIFKEHI